MEDKEYIYGINLSSIIIDLNKDRIFIDISLEKHMIDILGIEISYEKDSSVDPIDEFEFGFPKNINFVDPKDYMDIREEIFKELSSLKWLMAFFKEREEE